MTTLTKIHPNALRILLLIQGRKDRGLSPPSYREMCRALGITLNAVYFHATKLRRIGLLTWDAPPNCGRNGKHSRTLRANYRLELAQGGAAK